MVRYDEDEPHLMCKANSGMSLVVSNSNRSGVLGVDAMSLGRCKKPARPIRRAPYTRSRRMLNGVSRIAAGLFVLTSFPNKIPRSSVT